MEVPSSWQSTTSSLPPRRSHSSVDPSVLSSILVLSSNERLDWFTFSASSADESSSGSVLSSDSDGSRSDVDGGESTAADAAVVFKVSVADLLSLLPSANSSSYGSN